MALTCHFKKTILDKQLSAGVKGQSVFIFLSHRYRNCSQRITDTSRERKGKVNGNGFERQELKQNKWRNMQKQKYRKWKIAIEY